MQSTFGSNVVQAMEDQVQKNMTMFRDALKMFTPFGLAAGVPAAPASQDKGDIDTLKQQLDEMQKRLDKLSHS
jgi:polyhydroxyalkanoate synthesis regulator protein